MSASLNAVPSFNLASTRETAAASSGKLRDVRSNNRRDSFSQLLRRSSEDQRSSRVDRSRSSERKDSKPAKKDGDTNALSSTDPDNKDVRSTPLPISFLLGFPSVNFESFDPETSSGIAASQADAAQALNLGSADSSGTQDTKNSGIAQGGNNTKGAQGALSTNILAFAMRLGDGSGASNDSKPANSASAVSPVVSDSIQTNVAATASKIVQAAPGSSLDEKAHEHAEAEQGQSVPDLSAVGIAEPFEAKVAEDNAAGPAAQVPSEPAVPTSEPVRNVHMQLVSDDNRRVDVRLIDRGGELHVSVKSGDAALSQNLQDHLPDLTARLEKQHMQTEVWVPKAAESAKAESGNANGSLADQNARSYSGNSDREKDGRRQAKPDWVDALESYS
jgi:hypothetical protein